MGQRSAISSSYFQASRAPRYSLLFALPLLLLYEGLAAALSRDPARDVRNGADVLLTGLFASVAGPHGPLLLMTVLVGACIWLIARDLRANGRGLRPAVFGGMLAESAVLAFVFGVVVSLATAHVLAPLGAGPPGAAELLAAVPAAQSPVTFDLPRRLMVSLGAGLYEELVFRVLLVSALSAGARLLLGWGPRLAGASAVALSAVVFSAFHYIGPYGDPLELQSFVFRLIAGLAFSALYVLRGFGIVAWTHALYDVYVLVL